MKYRCIYFLFLLVSLASCSDPTPAGHIKPRKQSTHVVSHQRKKAKHTSSTPLPVQSTIQSSFDSIEIPKTNLSCRSNLIRHSAITIDYNDTLCLPNWVAYVLTREHTHGPFKRLDSFSPDPSVKEPVLHEDYTRNPGKYDRGHMAPAADMKWSKKAMEECFYTTNICPQNQNLNRGDWNDIEELVRDYASKYDSIYVVCGPIVIDSPGVIGRYHNITVPSAFFKALLRRTNGRWYTLGFVCQNVAGSKPLLSYVVSIDEIERLTGHDLYWRLPDDIEDKLEKDIVLDGWFL